MSASLERVAGLAVKLVEVRETIRRLWGAEYEAKIALHRELVRAVMRRDGV